MSGFWHWWSAELRELLPRASGHRRSRPRCIVLTPSRQHVVAYAEDKGGVTRVAMPDEADNALPGDPTAVVAQLGRTAGSRPVGIRVRHSDCLERVVMLPARARKDFDRLLMLDLERATPLRAADVLCAHLVEGPGSSDGLVAVRHLVVKRRVVEPLASAMRSAGLEPAFIECWNRDATAPLAATFSAGTSAVSRPRAPVLERGLAAVCALLLLALPVVDWIRKESTLASLTSELEQLRTVVQAGQQSTQQAVAVRAEVENLRRVLEQRPATLALLDEVTRLIPDDAWLDELRVEGESVEIAGMAASAAALLATFEKSRLVFDARFTAPVRLQSTTGQEQFRLRTRLRVAQPEVTR